METGKLVSIQTFRKNSWVYLIYIFTILNVEILKRGPFTNFELLFPVVSNIFS